MDGVVSPTTATQIGKLGGLAVLNLEGIWTRYADADKQLEKIAKSSPGDATKLMQQLYSEPVKPELVAQRIQEIKAAGVLAAASLTPQRVREYHVDRARGRASTSSSSRARSSRPSTSPRSSSRSTSRSSSRASRSRRSSAAAPATRPRCT